MRARKAKRYARIVVVVPCETNFVTSKLLDAIRPIGRRLVSGLRKLTGACGNSLGPGAVIFALDAMPVQPSAIPAASHLDGNWQRNLGERMPGRRSADRARMVRVRAAGAVDRGGAAGRQGHVTGGHCKAHLLGTLGRHDPGFVATDPSPAWLMTGCSVFQGMGGSLEQAREDGQI